MLRLLGNPYYNAPLRPLNSTFKLTLAHRATVHTLGGYIVEYAPRKYALIAEIDFLTYIPQPVSTVNHHASHTGAV